MGTAGGLVIDKNSRVLDGEGNAIKGLWACGNTTTALLPRYPGPGSTLGPVSYTHLTLPTIYSV